MSRRNRMLSVIAGAVMVVGGLLVLEDYRGVGCSVLPAPS
jgi:hypothetical protein